MLEGTGSLVQAPWVRVLNAIVATASGAAAKVQAMEPAEVMPELMKKVSTVAVEALRVIEWMKGTAAGKVEETMPAELTSTNDHVKGMGECAC